MYLHLIEVETKAQREWVKLPTVTRLMDKGVSIQTQHPGSRLHTLNHLALLPLGRNYIVKSRLS